MTDEPVPKIDADRARALRDRAWNIEAEANALLLVLREHGADPGVAQVLAEIATTKTSMARAAGVLGAMAER